MKKKFTFGFILACSSFAVNSQVNTGLVNNGAFIVLQNGANIYIDGANGHYSAYTDNGQDGLIKTQAGNGVIHVSGNWYNDSNDEAFDNDGTTVQLIGTNQTIGGTTSSTFDTLRLMGSGTKTLDVNTKVGGKTNNNGILSLDSHTLDLNKNTLTITNNSNNAITRSSGIIVSETVDITGNVGGIDVGENNSILAWEVGTNTGNYTYPFGSNSGTYIPVIINKTSGESNTIAVATRATAADDNQPWVDGVISMGSVVLGVPDATDISVIDRWWEIVPTDNNLVSDITLTYIGTENTTQNTAGTFALQRWNSTANNWEAQIGNGNATTAGIEQISATGVSVNGNSIFILSSSDFAGQLPITLTDLSLVCNDANTTVKWTTGSELNTDVFIVERSRDGFIWETVGEVQAAGNSTHPINYEITDNFKSSGNVYYKLIQLDINGDREEFGPITSTCFSDAANAMILYPNPASESFTLEVTNNFDVNETATIQLMDISGRMIEIRDAVFNPGVNQLFFNVQNLIKGTYILNVISESKFAPVKVIVF